MKIIKNILLCATVSAVLLPLGGCDMFRRLAGRPTAGELEQMRIEKLRAEEARCRHLIDSLSAVKKEKEDSIAILDSIAQMKGTILNPSDIGGLFTTRLDSRYYIVVGSFRNRHNAETLLSEVKDRGYSPILISFRNGFNAIAISPSNNLQDAFASLKAVRQEPFCPEDVWILVNE